MASSETTENHVRTWLLGLIATGIIAGVGVVWQLNNTVSVLGERISSVQVDLQRMRTEIDRGTEDRYRSKDAARDFGAVDKRIDAVEGRVGRLEGKQ